MVSLPQLESGRMAKLKLVDRASHCYARFLELGFTEGEEIRILRKAPLGGPLHVEIRDAQYAICRSDAEFIKVENL